MKIKSAILAIVFMTLCSCQKDKFQKICASDCLNSQNCSWNGTSVCLQGTTSGASALVSFVSKLNGDLYFELSQSNDYYNSRYLHVYSYNKDNSSRELVNLSEVETETKSYNVGVNKNDKIYFAGRGVVVSDITISSDGHGGIDDDDNQGDGWEDDF